MTLMMTEHTRSIDSSSYYTSLTRSIRSDLSAVTGLMTPAFLDEAERELKQQMTVLSRIASLRDSLMATFQGVADGAIAATGTVAPDTLIVNYAGSDLMAPLAFRPSKLVTIDNGDLLSTKALPADTRFIKELLNGLLMYGMHGHGCNMGRLAMGIHFALLGIDPQTLEVTEKSVVSAARDQIEITHMRYVLSNGQMVDHVNYANVNMPANFTGLPWHQRLRTMLAAELTGKVFVLSKAGSRISARPLYDIIPNGTVIVSDSDETYNIDASPYRGSVERISDGILSETLAETELIRRSKSDFPLAYGLCEVRDVGVYRFHR